MKNLLLLIGIWWILGPAQAQQIEYLSGERNRFGIVEGFWFPALTCDLGVGWERIIFDWSQHQPTGPEDWHTLNVDDRWLKLAALCDRQVVAILKNTPAWATDGIAGPGVPRGLDRSPDDPGNLWASFVYRTVSYYASRGVVHFILWNEPDIDPETYGHEFSGSLEDYFQLLKAGYLAAKRANPAAVIHLAGTTYWHDINRGVQPYFERLMDRILVDNEAVAHNHYFDVLSLHIYFRTQTVLDIVREVRAMLDDHGLSHKAVWINETNAAPTDDPKWPVVRPQFPLDLTQQASFLVQSASLSLAGGADHSAAYKLYDQELAPGAESFGLLSPADALPRPGLLAWAWVVRHFQDVVAANHIQSQALDLVILRHRGGQQTLVLWARGAELAEVRLAAATSKVYLSDQYGRMAMVQQSVDGYKLMLQPAQCDASEGCFIGGPVQMLVMPPGLFSLYEIRNGEQHELISFEEYE